MTIEANIALNKIYDVGRLDIAAPIGGPDVNGSFIRHDSIGAGAVSVCNYTDTVGRIAARTPAKGAASGGLFKVRPDDRAEEEYRVAPNKAHARRGRGDMEAV